MRFVACMDETKSCALGRRIGGILQSACGFEWEQLFVAGIDTKSCSYVLFINTGFLTNLLIHLSRHVVSLTSRFALLLADALHFLIPANVYCL